MIGMSELKVVIPDRIKQEFPHTEWSDIVKKAVNEEFRKLMLIKLFDELFKCSTITDKKCITLGKKVNKTVHLKIEKELSKG